MPCHDTPTFPKKSAIIVARFASSGLLCRLAVTFYDYCANVAFIRRVASTSWLHFRFPHRSHASAPSTPWLAEVLGSLYFLNGTPDLIFILFSKANTSLLADEESPFGLKMPHKIIMKARKIKFWLKNTRLLRKKSQNKNPAHSVHLN